MPAIHLQTHIPAPVNIVFDLARSIELHLESTKETGERVVAGRTSGLCRLNDTITWSAVHFGIRQQLTVHITAMELYRMFEDQMVKGAFRSMKHRHHFEQSGNGTLMTDVFEYTVPFGIAGRLFDRLLLRKHLLQLLITRNNTILQKATRTVQA